MNPDSQNLFVRVSRGTQSLGVLMTHMDNPVYTGPNSKLISYVLQDEGKVPYHVSIDPFLNESNLFFLRILKLPKKYRHPVSQFGQNLIC